MTAWNLPSRSATFNTPDGRNLTFSQFIWKVFHQVPGVNCDTINDRMCGETILCEDQLISPAGNLIYNSMVWLNTVINQPTFVFAAITYPNRFSRLRIMPFLQHTQQ
jgi:hypothetical protein